MKLLFFFFINSFVLLLNGQELKTYHPKVTRMLDFSDNEKRAWEIRDQLLADLASGEKSWDKLDLDDARLLEQRCEIYKDMWDVLGSKKNWNQFGKPRSVIASSYLAAEKYQDYFATNANDLNFKTTWAESGENGSIGEKITFEFRPETPRITKIHIVNGYVKNERMFKNVSRAKLLKVYVNETPYALFYLNDISAVQTFEVDTLGYGNRDNIDKLKAKKNWKLTFEIVDLYPGRKYNNVAITEIFFDGVDY